MTDERENDERERGRDWKWNDDDDFQIISDCVVGRKSGNRMINRFKSVECTESV